MINTKEHLTNIIPHLEDTDVDKIWDIMKLVLRQEIMEEIIHDLSAVNDIKTNPDCHEYISEVELLSELGLTESHL